MTPENKATQNDMILQHLQEHGSITPMDAMNEYGCMRLGARIFDLKQRGIPIASEMVHSVNRFGRDVQYKRYWLKEHQMTMEATT